MRTGQGQDQEAGAATGARDIVVLLDGTSNEISRKRTNILRLYGCLEKSERQVVWYDPGVGTFGADNAWSRWLRRGAEIFGMATGHGMDRNVKEAYRFLVQTWRPAAEEGGADDRIWISGFSRGAYTARVLAGFLHAFGLMAPEQLHLLDYAYNAYKAIGSGGDLDRDGDGEIDGPFGEIALHERALQPRKVQVTCLALFDTVASVIEPGRFTPRLAQHAYSSNNPSVLAVRHAVAIDERRSMYRPRLWGDEREVRLPYARRGTGRAQDVDEQWFAGVHGDIGGGYAEIESGLGKVPLAWMLGELRALGLHVRDDLAGLLVEGTRESAKYVAPDPAGPMHVSLRRGWWILEVVPGFDVSDAGRPGRRICGMTFPLGARRRIPEGATIHPSVAERRAALPGYAPPNLPGI